MPDEETLSRIYGSWYRPEDGRFAGLGDRLLRCLRGRFARRLDRIAPPGPILDVGAGDGALLAALRSQGRSATGIDPYSSSHPSVSELSLDQVNGPWSGIVFWHSLEHLPDPGESLDLAASLLGSRGVLVIALPNPASLQSAVFGDSWFAIDYPCHVVHVPAPVLLDRLERLGLTVERLSYARGGQIVFGWLYGFLGLIPGSADLYDAIRRPRARRTAMTGPRRFFTLAAAGLLLPLGWLAAGLEIALRRSGVVYVEARRV